MEKNWYQKLMTACANYLIAVEKGKSEEKLDKLMSDWESVSEQALAAGNSNRNFEEILSWLGFIAPIFESTYYSSILQNAAQNEREKLLAVMLAGNSEEVIAAADKAELTLLAEVAEYVISKNSPRDKTRENFLTALNNRPDILVKFKSETFAKFTLCNESTSFLKNEKLKLLLNCFKDAKDYRAFADKIKTGERFSRLFNNNEEILKNWGELSSQELLKAENFQKAVNVFTNSSLTWQSNLGNFKKILELINGDLVSFEKLITKVVDTFGCNSFYCHAAEATRSKWLKQQLKEGGNVKEIFELAARYESRATKLQRKVLKEFLK